MAKNYRFTLLYISWMVLITLLSLFRFSEVDVGEIAFPNLDKIVHFVFYFFAVVLGMYCLAERRGDRFSVKKAWLALVLLSIGYGVLIEGLQWIMPFDREADIWDIVANSLGAVLGGLLIQKYGLLNTGLN